jgi:hypothetical protein
MRISKELLVGAGLTFFMTSTSYAYIPEYTTIVSRAADRHGKGYYQIDQDVTYRKDADSYTVREVWVVGGEGSMRVSLEGKGNLRGLVSGTITYDGGVRRYIENGPRLQKLTDLWWEPFFHFRNSKYLRQRLVGMKAAPADSLKDRPALSSDADPDYTAPEFMRLSRVGGTTAWVISQSAGSAPALWIEQDQFVVRKFKGSDQSVVHADDYAKFDEGLYLPRSRTYSFGPHNVQIQVQQVKSLGSKWSAPTTATAEPLKLPEPEGLRDFYQRYR